MGGGGVGCVGPGLSEGGWSWAWVACLWGWVWSVMGWLGGLWDGGRVDGWILFVGFLFAWHLTCILISGKT